MSLFDTLLGNSSHADTNTNATQSTSQVEDKNTNTASTQNQQQTQATTGSTTTNSTTNQANQSQATGVNSTSTLDAGTVSTLQQLLTSLISNPASGGAQGAVNSIAGQLQTKAGTPAVSSADIAGKQSAAVTSFNQNENVDINRLQDAIGSKNNTYSALVAGKGQQDLSATLAGIVADADTTNAQISNQQLTAAVQALTSGAGIGATDIQNILGIVSALKGANTTEDTSQGITGSTAQTTGSTTIQDLLEAINGLTTQNTTQDEQTAATGTTNSTTGTSGSQGSGLLGLIF